MKKHVIELIGNTPIVEVGVLGMEHLRVGIKLEGNNPGGSIKDRAVYGMLREAMSQGVVKKGSRLIEPTSGNTGIALAMIGQTLGLKVTIVMPETMSIERRNIIKAYGAELVLTDGTKGMKGAIEKANTLISENEGAVMLNQFENPGNWKYHYETTAEEIIKEHPEITHFVAGVGTGGTITGVGKRLKEFNPSIQIIAVEPQSSNILSGGSPGPHKIQGIGAGFKPEVLDLSIVDRIIQVTDEEAFEATRLLMKQEGLFLGISSGANFHAASTVAKEVDAVSTIITISPDGGLKYMSMNVFNG